MKISPHFLNFDIFNMLAQNIDHGYTRRGDANEYPQSMFRNNNKNNRITPVNPINVGYKGVYITQTCYRDVEV